LPLGFFSALAAAPEKEDCGRRHLLPTSNTRFLLQTHNQHRKMSALATSSAAPARLGFTSSVSTRVRSAAARVPSQPTKQRGALQVVAGNKNEGGLFAPVVIVARNVIGIKPFNQIRGKAIALHSQVR
jgi:hypothetical protein